MKDNLLEEGDVIELKEGHKVRTKIPVHFLYDNRKGDWSLDEGVVTIKE